MTPWINTKTGYTACIVLALIMIMAVPVSAAENDNPIVMSGQTNDSINAYNLGAELASQGKFQEALLETEKALAIEPNWSLALAQKAGLQNALGKYQDALASADAAIAAGTSDMPDAMAAAWANRADALVHLGRYQDAIDSASRALMIDPTIEGAKTTRLLAGKMLENSATALPTTTRKAPATLVPVIGALFTAGIIICLHKRQI
ncbi:MAG: tetratricopeptide repeat protein [Methanoregulaceae archaeon]|jgi:tetratricopeptide (TPR) repeat protein|nr:tetratricopeptide repeat protein [Methanoregulaceae archaeon]